MDKPIRIGVGRGTNWRENAVILQPGAGPGLFWLGGFCSDMGGTKASALAGFGKLNSLAVTRFDYSGHGQSGGDFSKGTISDWLEESLVVFERFTTGPQILVGSSMGGWLALLLARELRARGACNVAGLVLIAPAVDMTMDLMEDGFSGPERAQMSRQGFVERPSDYGAPYILTSGLIEDGRRHRLFGSPIRTGCPVHILTGARDEDVPPAHSLKLASHVLEDPLNFTLVPDGDHSLSRPQDIALFERALTGMISGIRSD
jgi:pimeloyl-ACP methyl ester carboxylesterase